MADFISSRFRPNVRVADVASGNGQLQARLFERGFRDITSWDTRKRNAKPRRTYRRALFDYRSAPRGYDLVIGMHPDGATDHIVGYATKHRVPFVVCPCCVIPSAFKYEGYQYDHWIDHLARIALQAGFKVERQWLHIKGRSTVLIGQPA